MATKLQITGGALFIEPYATDGVTLGDKIAFGTTDEITLSTEVEKVQHNDTETKESVLDGDYVVGRTVTLSFTTADISPTMLSRAYLGSTSAVTQSAAVDVAVVTAAVIIGGRYNTGYRNVTSVVVKDVTDATTYVEGTDYTLAKKGGYIVILDGGSISATDVLHLTVNAPAGTGTLINAMQLDALQGRLTYTGEASVGDSHEYVFEKVSLNASGDVALKSGEFTTISFEGSALKHLGKYFTTETF
ncbi:MAG: hypothetical protein WC967_11815 [Balneolaceae bacterium]